MKRSLIVNQSPTPIANERLEHIWKRLAVDEAWPQGPGGSGCRAAGEGEKARAA